MIDRLEAGTARLLVWAVTPWRQAFLVSLLSVAVLLPGLTSLPVTDRDEARFAQASKQMIETGDVIDIRFQDQPRWKKPAGIYWLQAASASLIGGAEAPIWAYRLPSVLAAWLTALLALWAARPLIGPRGALLAGAMTATTLLLAAEGNIAKTDAALAASAAGALGGLAHIFLGRGGWGPALVFWFSIAASILLKGPIVPAIAAFALAALAWRRETRTRFRKLHVLPGLAVAAILTAPWLMAIWQISDGAFFAESLGKDMGSKMVAGQEKHWGPPGLYLGLVWLTFWPWAALIPLAAGWTWAQRRTSWGLFLLAWIIPFWLILEAVPTKLPHYVLPLYPALAILAAGWLLGALAQTTDQALSTALTSSSQRRGSPGSDQIPAATGTTQPPQVPYIRPSLRWIAAILTAAPPVILALALLAGAVFIAWTANSQSIRPLENTTPPWIATFLALLAAAAAVLAARALLSTRLLAYGAGAMLSAILVYTSLLQFGLPRLGFVFPSPAMAQTIAQYRPCASGPAFSVGYHEPSLVFLTETGIRMADPSGAVQALATDPGAMILITARWEKILGDLPPSVRRETFRYFNYNRGKSEFATLLTPDDARWNTCTR